MSESPPTLYDALGLTPEASGDKIRKTCKKMIQSVRESDSRNSEKNELIRFIKKSRDTLKDTKSRETYDRTIGIETLTKETSHDHGTFSGLMDSISPLISSTWRYKSHNGTLRKQSWSGSIQLVSTKSDWKHDGTVI